MLLADEFELNPQILLAFENRFLLTVSADFFFSTYQGYNIIPDAMQVKHQGKGSSDMFQQCECESMYRFAWRSFGGDENSDNSIRTTGLNDDV